MFRTPDMSIVRSFAAFFRPIFAGAILLVGVTACSYSNGDPDEAPRPCDVSAQAVTYAGVISPIFDANCRACHGSSVASTRGSGIDLGDYQNLSRYPVVSLLGSIEHTAGYSPMPKGRAKLSECDIQRIRAWISAGKPNN